MTIKATDMDNCDECPYCEIDALNERADKAEVRLKTLELQVAWLSARLSELEDSA